MIFALALFLAPSVLLVAGIGAIALHDWLASRRQVRRLESIWSLPSREPSVR